MSERSERQKVDQLINTKREQLAALRADVVRLAAVAAAANAAETAARDAVALAERDLWALIG